MALGEGVVRRGSQDCKHPVGRASPLTHALVVADGLVLLRLAATGSPASGSGREVRQPPPQASGGEVRHVQLAQDGEDVGLEGPGWIAGVLSPRPQVVEVVLDGPGNGQPACRPLALLGQLQGLGPGRLEVEDADAVCLRDVVRDPQLLDDVPTVDPPPQQQRPALRPSRRCQPREARPVAIVTQWACLPGLTGTSPWESRAWPP